MSIDGIFMSIGAALEFGPESKSFEEVRIEDYIKAYQTTARPPQPVIQEPIDENQRKALNLPPLFKPKTLPMGGGGLASTSAAPLFASGAKPKILDPAELPLGQEFRLPTVAGEKHHNIACMSEYEAFSQEELRYYAYARGNIKAPVLITMDPFVLPKDPSKEPTLGYEEEEQLQTISARKEYRSHSLEELRVAYILHGREMTSIELLASSVLPGPPLAPTIPAPLVPLPQPIYASSTPKFTFGLR